MPPVTLVTGAIRTRRNSTLRSMFHLALQLQLCLYESPPYRLEHKAYDGFPGSISSKDAMYRTRAVHTEGTDNMALVGCLRYRADARNRHLPRLAILGRGTTAIDPQCNRCACSRRC